MDLLDGRWLYVHRGDDIYLEFGFARLDHEAPVTYDDVVGPRCPRWRGLALEPRMTSCSGTTDLVAGDGFAADLDGAERETERPRIPGAINTRSSDRERRPRRRLGHRRNRE